MTETHALVPIVPTKKMLEAYDAPCLTIEPHPDGRPATQYLAMLAAAPNAGKVSKELRDKAAEALYHENGGTDEYDWKNAPEPQRSWVLESVDAVFAAIDLQVEG